MTIDRTKLINLITEADRKAANKPGYNPYALAHMFKAADEAIAECTSYGSDRAFARNFTPTRTNHGIARKLGLNLDVQRGRWEYAVSPSSAT